MNQTIILTHFKTNLVKFIDELVEQFPEEEDLIMAHILLKSDQIPITSVFDKFMKFIVPQKDRINNRDSGFFLSDDDIFTQISPSRKGTMKRMWSSPNIDDEDREIIWQWLDTLLHITSKAVV